MTELPAGTVTFLFTDIEGSTQLLKQLGPDRYGQLLTDQRSILRSAFREYGGTEIDTQGDAFFVSFTRATDAIAAVVQILRTLQEKEWPDSVDLRVRMGLHTGEPRLIEEGYVGMDVHRAARILHRRYRAPRQPARPLGGRAVVQPVQCRAFTARAHHQGAHESPERRQEGHASRSG